jgi:hypothetical protein
MVVPYEPAGGEEAAQLLVAEVADWVVGLTQA